MGWLEGHGKVVRVRPEPVMTSPEEEMKVYRLLEDKLSKIADSVGYKEEPVESEEHRAFESAWRAYLDDIGLKSVSENFIPDEDLYMSFDPLYTCPGKILIPWEEFKKILILGLP